MLCRAYFANMQPHFAIFLKLLYYYAIKCFFYYQNQTIFILIDTKHRFFIAIHDSHKGNVWN